MPAAGVDAPIPAIANVAAYWAMIQKNEHAAKVLIELRRGLGERPEMIRSSAIATEHPPTAYEQLMFTRRRALMPQIDGRSRCWE
jgi:hypothetical protein